jgi:hypothetical protein
MIKICGDCGRQNNSKYAFRCRSCYYKNVTKENIPIKICVECNCNFKKLGIRCYSCMSKIRYESWNSKICIQCHKSKIHYRGLSLCNNCYDKNKDIQVPGYKEKRLLSQRNTLRKSKGINILLPRIRSEKGNPKPNAQGYRFITKVILIQLKVGLQSMFLLCQKA